MGRVERYPAGTFCSVELLTPRLADDAAFYRDLLGWDLAEESPQWCTMAMPGVPVNLAFQTEPLHERPTWPAAPGTQQMQLHLDFEVDDLAGAVHDALALGAELPEHQPQADVRVLLDPAGHPFCLYTADAS